MRPCLKKNKTIAARAHTHTHKLPLFMKPFLDAPVNHGCVHIQSSEASCITYITLNDMSVIMTTYDQVPAEKFLSPNDITLPCISHMFAVMQV